MIHTLKDTPTHLATGTRLALVIIIAVRFLLVRLLLLLLLVLIIGVLAETQEAALMLWGLFLTLLAFPLRSV